MKTLGILAMVVMLSMVVSADGVPTVVTYVPNSKVTEVMTKGGEIVNDKGSPPCVSLASARRGRSPRQDQSTSSSSSRARPRSSRGGPWLVPRTQLPVRFGARRTSRAGTTHQLKRATSSPSRRRRRTGGKKCRRRRSPTTRSTPNRRRPLRDVGRLRATIPRRDQASMQVFVSVGATHTPEQEAFVSAFEVFLSQNGCTRLTDGRPRQ